MSDTDRPTKPLAPTRRGALTRTKLIDAGRKAFSAYGYDAARIADVVRLAGVSHGNFYRHFTDKDDLLHAVLDELHMGLRHPVRRQQPSAEGGMLGEMIDYNSSFFHTYAEHRDMLRVAREAAAKPGPSRFLDTWLEMRVPFIERNRRWMEKLQAKGVIDPAMDVALMAESLGSMIEQLAYVHIGLPKQRPTAERLDELGRTCGVIWFRSIFGGATVEPDIAAGGVEQ
ncbi:TetR family transcriptional regulator [Novosphingobium sp. FGD1]|uniref:TetR family transcriptional regulator n=1 Tax=Novosphingobium silvae TaxID=2692619 RepID=A0A7X4GJE8_9SPHN|nr:TetR/AcrR family transcriptional regulator [Novosphingobium silvae]MYL99750.1 TetR family transcriptional regulator [Novosphingobium silvae]